MPVPIWDAGILSGALEAINGAADGAFDALMPAAKDIFWYVKTTAFCMVVGTMLVTRRFMSPDFARMLLIFAGIGWLLQVFPYAAHQVIQALANVGTIVVPDMQFSLNDPGAIAWFGFKAVVPLMTAARGYLGPIAIFFHFFEVVFYLVAIIMVILAFTVLALHIFFAQIEFLILSVAAWFCIPFAAFNKTSFVATKGIGYVASVGLRVLALSLLAAFSTVALVMFEGAKIEGLPSAFGLIVLAAALLVSNIKAPSVAAALINSGPVMDAGMAWQAMRAGASGGLRTLGSGTGGGAIGGMVRGVSSVATAAGGMASAGLKAASAAWNTGSTSKGGGGSNQSGQAGQSGRSSSTSTQGQYRGGWSSGNRSAASPKPANPKNP